MYTNNQNLAGQNDTSMEDLKKMDVNFRSDYILDNEESKFIGKVSRMSVDDLKKDLNEIRSSSPASERRRSMYEYAIDANNRASVSNDEALVRTSNDAMSTFRSADASQWSWKNALDLDISVAHSKKRSKLREEAKYQNPCIIDEEESKFISRISRMEIDELQNGVNEIRSTSPASRRKKEMYEFAIDTNKRASLSNDDDLRRENGNERASFRSEMTQWNWKSACKVDIGANTLKRRGSATK